MGTVLIVFGFIFGMVALIILYATLCILVIEADYWWQKILCILVMCAFPIILMVVGAMMILNG